MAGETAQVQTVASELAAPQTFGNTLEQWYNDVGHNGGVNYGAWTTVEELKEVHELIAKRAFPLSYPVLFQHDIDVSTRRHNWLNTHISTVDRRGWMTFLLGGGAACERHNYGHTPPANDPKRNHLPRLYSNKDTTRHVWSFLKLGGGRRLRLNYMRTKLHRIDGVDRAPTADSDDECGCENAHWNCGYCFDRGWTNKREWREYHPGDGSSCGSIDRDRVTSDPGDDDPDPPQSHDMRTLQSGRRHRNIAHVSTNQVVFSSAAADTGDSAPRDRSSDGGDGCSQQQLSARAPVRVEVDGAASEQHGSGNSGSLDGVDRGKGDGNSRSTSIGNGGSSGGDGGGNSGSNGSGGGDRDGGDGGNGSQGDGDDTGGRHRGGSNGTHAGGAVQ